MFYNLIKIFYSKNLLNKFRFYFIDVNFGPQHPATHGVLRLILVLNGEYIMRAEPQIGFLHRGTEKLIEIKTITQSLPYFDRLDYVSMLANEHVFALGIERLLKIKVSLRVQYLRIILVEITRILNHLLAVGSCALDLGAMTVLLWFFEEREKLLEICERISGARMHANFIRPGGLRNDISDDILVDIYFFCKNFVERLDDVDALLTSNRIWKQRLVDVGIISYVDALSYGLSGVLLRSTGFRWDLRKVFDYEQYKSLSFDVSCGLNGDCYDRYLMRMFEMRQSVLIILQCMNKLPNGEIFNSNLVNSLGSRFFFKESIASLIKHTKVCNENRLKSVKDCYVSVESPKGELGVVICSGSSSTLYRCHIRTPGFVHINIVNKLSRGYLIADLVTIIGTLDIVFGEIDR